MNIGILGAGNIGGALGKQWAKAGHSIKYGVRDPGKAEVKALLAALGRNASAGSVAEAIDFGEVVVFAIPGRAMEETISANARVLDGKIVVDSANKFGGPSANSLATFAAQTPQARVYRVFNTYGWEIFDNPTFPGGPPEQFYCGPEGDRPVIETLIQDVGLAPLYVGGPEQADVVDGMLKLWIALANGQKMGRGLAFKMLRR